MIGRYKDFEIYTGPYNSEGETTNEYYFCWCEMGYLSKAGEVTNPRIIIDAATHTFHEFFEIEAALSLFYKSNVVLDIPITKKEIYV
jgi:hypothetical protein